MVEAGQRSLGIGNTAFIVYSAFGPDSTVLLLADPARLPQTRGNDPLHIHYVADAILF